MYYYSSLPLQPVRSVWTTLPLRHQKIHFTSVTPLTAHPCCINLNTSPPNFLRCQKNADCTERSGDLLRQQAVTVEQTAAIGNLFQEQEG